MVEAWKLAHIGAKETKELVIAGNVPVIVDAGHNKDARRCEIEARLPLKCLR